MKRKTKGNFDIINAHIKTTFGEQETTAVLIDRDTGDTWKFTKGGFWMKLTRRSDPDVFKSAVIDGMDSAAVETRS